MAVKLAEAYIEITARMDKLNAQLEAGKSTFSRWATNISTLVGGVAIFATIERGVQAIAAASFESARAISAMNTALASSGRGDQIDRFDKLSESFKTLGQDDEPIKRVIAQIANLSTASVDDIERATAAAVGLSQVLGIGLPEATKAMLKATQGNFMLLGRMGVEFDEGATNAEKLQRVFELAEKGIDQMAAKSTSFLGTWERIKLAIGDAMEFLGGGMAKGSGDSVKELQGRLSELYRERGAPETGVTTRETKEEIQRIETALSAAYAAQAGIREAKAKADAAAATKEAEAEYARRYKSPVSEGIGDAAGGLSGAVRGGIAAAGAGLARLRAQIESNAGDPTGGGRAARIASAQANAMRVALDLMGQLPGANDAVERARSRIADYRFGEGRSLGQTLYNRDTFTGTPTGTIANIRLPSFGGISTSTDVPRDMLKELREQTKRLDEIRDELKVLGVAP